MSTTQTERDEAYFSADAGVFAPEGKVGLAKAQAEIALLKGALEAQAKIEAIRSEYVALRSQVSELLQLKGQETPSEAEKEFMNELDRQEQALQYLAGSLSRLVN